MFANDKDLTDTVEWVLLIMKPAKNIKYSTLLHNLEDIKPVCTTKVWYG